jgi:hypothetical protein
MATSDRWQPLSQETDPSQRRRREAAVARAVREHRNTRRGLKAEHLCPTCAGCLPSDSDDVEEICQCGSTRNWEAKVAHVAGVLRDAGFSPDHPNYDNPPPEPARKAFQLIKGGLR